MREALKNMARILSSAFTPGVDKVKPSRNLKEAISRLDSTSEEIKHHAAEVSNSEVLMQMLEQIR
jgi:hypothetical protein